MADGSATIARSRLFAAIADERRNRVNESEREAAKVKARAHEAVRPGPQRQMAVDWGSGNRIVSTDAKQLRDSARALCRDYDVANNAIKILVQNSVGSGIDVRAVPRRLGEPVNTELAAQLMDLWDEWWDRPEVTWAHDYGKCQQLLATSAFRDGEAFRQQLIGPVDYLDHGSRVPFSLELLEADMIPLNYTDDARRILQGVERNAWGRVTHWHVYKQHPGELNMLSVATKRVPAEQLLQLANIDRIGQVRGLSIFASVMNRFRDIQDYENSERIAAKVAASYCAQIVKKMDNDGPPPSADDAMGGALDRVYRSLTMVPGMIGDDLRPGEELQIIDSKRPNPNVATFVDGQLRRAAGPLMVSFSSLAMNYNGTYSAQRQELVEKYGGYAMLGEWFVARVVRPDWNSFVSAAVLAGLVKLPRNWTLRDAQRAVFIRPQMPWIDPLKEVLAMGERVDRRWMADPQAIILSGNDPDEVRRLQDDWDAQSNPTTKSATKPDLKRDALRDAAVTHAARN